MALERFDDGAEHRRLSVAVVVDGPMEDPGNQVGQQHARADPHRCGPRFQRRRNCRQRLFTNRERGRGPTLGWLQSVG